MTNKSANNSNCLFCKIVNKEIKADIVLETEDYLAFSDINPFAPVHVLVIPKNHYSSLNDLNDIELMGKLLHGAKEVAEKLNIKDEGYRLILNTGEKAGQEVFHIHLHVLGGRDMLWPPG